MVRVSKPILPGFHPDPFLVRAGEKHLQQFVDDFDTSALNLPWSTLYEPAGASGHSRAERPKFLCRHGRHSLHLIFDRRPVGFCRLPE